MIQISITGRAGSGKTTIAKLIARILRNYCCSVTFEEDNNLVPTEVLMTNVSELAPTVVITTSNEGH